jgi:hypothetical protein
MKLIIPGKRNFALSKVEKTKLLKPEVTEIYVIIRKIANIEPTKNHRYCFIESSPFLKKIVTINVR